MEYFETRLTMNMDTYMDTFRELGRHAVPLEEKNSIVRRQIAGFIIAVVSVICFIILNNNTSGLFLLVALFGFLSVFIVPWQYKRQFKHITKTNFARMQETASTSEMELVISFTDDKIKIYNTTTGNTGYVDYNVIVRYAEIEKLYALFTKENQSIFVNKISIAQEKKTEEFIRFIRAKCKSIQW